MDLLSSFLSNPTSSTFRAKLTLYIQCEESSIRPYYCTVVVQMIVGGSQCVGTCIPSNKGLEGDIRVAINYP